MGKREAAEVLSAHRIPIREVSGLAVRSTAEGLLRVVAVGDRSNVVAAAPVSSDGVPGEWIRIDLDVVPGAVTGLAQLEAVAADGADLVVALAEEPARLVAGDAATHEVLGWWDLDLSSIPDLDAAWAAESNSRGEGVVLMRSGHLLVAKEKRPAGLIEFATAGRQPLGIGANSFLAAGEAWQPPEGHSLTALAWWPLGDDGFGDVSDVALDPSGTVWLLSDQDRCLAPLAGVPAVGGTARLGGVVHLPKRIAKPEGLAFLPDGTVLVAVDVAEDVDNLFRLRLPAGLAP